jgi:hypothetical protein
LEFESLAKHQIFQYYTIDSKLKSSIVKIECTVQKELQFEFPPNSIQSKEVGRLILTVDFWMLAVGYYLLAVILVVDHFPFSFDRWMLDVGCWMLDVGYWLLTVGS